MRFQQILKYRCHIRANSTSSHILQILYPDNSMTARKIAEFVCSKPSNYTRNIVQKLLHAGYLEFTGSSQKYCRQYSLTQTGRWFAISCRLQNIPFLALCLLAEAYCAVRMARNNAVSSPFYIEGQDHVSEFYMISSFRRLFDSSYGESVGAIYSKRSISNAAKCLVDRNLAYRPYHSDILRIPANALTNLQTYDHDLQKLHQWNYDVSSKCRDIFLEDHTITDKQRELFALVC